MTRRGFGLMGRALAGRGVRGALLAGTLVLAGGCGYEFGGLHRPGIQTVHVQMFATREFRRDLEFRLTEAVKKRVNLDTPYRVASEQKADTILRGEVLEVRQDAFAPDFLSRLPREKVVTLAVRVEWKDLRTGRVLVDQPVLLSSTDYLPPVGETEEFALDRVVNRMAECIVEKMYADW